MNNEKLDYLQRRFPKLTETNQFYVLGLAEGLKQAQRTARVKTVRDGDERSESQARKAELRPNKDGSGAAI